MIVDPIVILVALALGLSCFMLGIVFKTMPEKKKDKATRDYNNSIMSTAGVIERMNNSNKIQSFGSRSKNTKELNELFRKAKNPWNMTPATFNAVRYGGLIIPGIIGLSILPLDWTISLIFFAIAGMCYILPKKHYQDVARSREAQWNQLYQFIWVIKHNLNYFDPKKTFNETADYIKEHSETLPELVEGFYDFANHWNGKYMDNYIKETYGDFVIPKQLFEIVLTSQLTGEYPNNELTSLRTIILEKMNFHVQEVLSTVGMKATSYSAPFLLVSVGLVILVPVALSIMQAFS